MVKYAFQDFDKDRMARASATNLSISLKKSVETLKEIRGKRVSAAISYLNQVIEQKRPVSYRRYGAEVAHKKGKGIASGGYPVKVAKEILRLLNSAKKNALEQELDEDLYIISASARKGSTRYHSGRNSGLMKATNVEIVVGVKE